MTERLKGFTDIDDLIAEFERDDPKMVERLRKARQELAPILYPNGGEHYERMMRGDPPERRNGD